jgi:hypothetical protein
MDTLIAHNWSALPQMANTPNHVTSSFEYSASREFTDVKDAQTKALAHRLGSNPLLSMAFTGFIFTLAGLAVAVVGAAVSEVPNFTDLPTGNTWRGHDPDDGTITLKDAKDTLNGGPEMIATSWTVEHCPFLE